MTRPAKDFTYWKDLLLRDWAGRLALLIVLVFARMIWAQGDGLVQSKILETVKPGMDSLKIKVDTLKQQVGDVKAEQEKQGRVQQEFFGAMMEVIPGLKKAVQDRGKQNADVVTKKAETETLLNNLTEIKP